MKQAILLLLTLAIFSCSNKEVKVEKESVSLTTTQMEAEEVPPVEIKK
ncbi:hypothetical protein [Pontibacter sp. SGAir0037]|nr:hypothetical protein [Pontibacter sp. SGAir0037]